MAKLAIANWKMNGLANEGRVLVHELSEKLKRYEHNVIICPPFTVISQVGEVMRGTGFALGAQDCHHLESGAYTGDISATMLADIRCNFVIAGHSERRIYHHESSDLVAKKVVASIKSGLTPIVCIGENLSEREQGNHFIRISDQLLGSIPDNMDFAEIVIAYEPVWAIGTGKVATSDNISEMHNHIKAELKKRFPANAFQVVYGGSVNKDNATEILSLAEVDGVLVGGASLKAEDFSQIVIASL